MSWKSVKQDLKAPSSLKLFAHDINCYKVATDWCSGVEQPLNDQELFVFIMSM